MKRFILTLFIIATAFALKAQQNHFVYIQTDNKQPFYIKMNSQLFSSSSTGYIVIPKLQNGSYSLNIGFPKNEWPQQTIPLNIDNDDMGFMLKNFGDKGWGLFNMETLNVTMAAAPGTVTSIVQNKTDAFSNTLADVVNTPSIKQEKKEVIKETPAIPVVEKAVVPINLISTTIDNTGRSVTYIDKSDNSSDTIKIFIPYTSIKKEVKEPVAVNAVAASVPIKEEQVKNSDDSKSNAKFLDIELPNPNKKDTAKAVPSIVKENPAQTELIPQATRTSDVTDQPKSDIIKSAAINSDCKSQANDNDFLKLRKRMAAEDNDDDMIAVARKTFKSTCFSTVQIKNLSVLFLKDDGRYKFFDAAYPFVYDTQNFSSLQQLLTDPYFIDRFKAMIRH